MDSSNIIIYNTADGKDYSVRHYALPMILAVGFRVRKDLMLTTGN